MAHFAELESKTDPTGFTADTHLIVTRVVVIDDDNEADGENWCNTFFGGGTWKQTSYNTFGNEHSLGGTAFRKNYAGVGFTYDESNDAFIAPKPHNSFTLNDSTYLWESPITYPDDGKPYIWNETLYQSDNSKGWVEI